MFLKSNYHDFYDTIIHQSGDDGLMFVRNFDKNKAQIVLGDFHLPYNNMVIVGFCGKTYIGLVLPNRDINSLKTWIKYNTIWGIDNIFQYLNIDPNKKWWSYLRGSETYRARYEAYLKRAEKYFEEYGPIWIIESICDNISITVNPILNRWNFAKALPPQEAFLALRAWVISQHRPEKAIPKVSDETMAEIKGFSAKTSFRREKGEGPKRKRKGK